MPFVAPRGAATNSTAGSANRNTFRPPWVKEDGTSSLKPTAKTTVPWAKKTATSTNSDKDNGTNSETVKKPTTTTTTAAATKKPIESTTVKKTSEPVKKITTTPVKKVEPTVNKQPVAAVNKTMTPAKKTMPAAKQTQKVVPVSSSSSSEEEEDDEEETDEEETEEEETEEEESEEEEDTEEEVKVPAARTTNAAAAGKKITPPVALKKTPNAQVDKTSELERRFTLEKPKLRPVVVKRDKSMKKVQDDDEAEEGETEEERERRLRFKLEKPKLRHVKREEKPLPSKSSENILKIRPVLKKVNKIDEIIKEPKEEPKPEFKTKTLRKAPSIKNVPAPPPIPSLVPKAPPPPPPINGGDKRELTNTQKAVIDRLKSRPRRRVDWSEMMKEVESGRKLRHVECNDRSAPITKCKSITKVDDKFIFETEKDNSMNKLLQQIQGGIKLKPTKTNDRSRPVLDGLRKFRRQMTIEEQLQKSQSKVNMLGATPGAAAAAGMGAGSARGSIVSAISIDELSGDDLDDIDNVRDDLQSTKQMLALELRNREAQERENKKLLAQIATLEAELVREKSREKNLEYGSNVIVATMEATPVSEECYLKSLKEEADEARQMAKDLEKKYLATGEQLDQAKSELDEQKRQIQKLERQLAQALQGDFLDGSRRPSDVHGADSAAELDESESDPDEPEEKKQERREKRMGKEVKVLRGKLIKVKSKQEAAKKEKQVLKEAMKKNHVILKEENKKFKKLEKEVQKMAASMKENEDEDEDDDDEKEEEEPAVEEEEEEESEEESEESEESESESETTSESEAEDASNSDKKNNLEPRVKKHESRLLAMKKCNVLLQANVDNLQDEITQVRSRAGNLQHELDSVLADLGF